MELGDAFLNSAYHRRATARYHEARVVADQAGDCDRENLAAFTEGATWSLAGDYRGAIEPMQRAAALAREARDLVWEYCALMSLSRTCDSTTVDDPAHAAELRQQAQTIVRSHWPLALALQGSLMRTAQKTADGYVCAEAPAFGGRRSAVLGSALCACYYCLAYFPPESVRAWTGGDPEPLCPFCAMDTVLGSASGSSLSQESLSEARETAFGHD